LVFNEKPNIPKEEFYRIKAIAHNCKVKGIETQYERATFTQVEGFISWLRGIINHIVQVNPSKGKRLQDDFNIALKAYRHKEEEAGNG
jgi:hypothetical protein